MLQLILGLGLRLAVMYFVDQAPAYAVKFNVGIGTELVLFPDPAQLPVASDKKLGRG